MKRGIDYIGVGVGAAIFNVEGKLLITQRGPKAKNERGTWEIPGGSVELGETFQKALKREIQEELGIEIDVLDLLGICDHIIPKEKQHWVSPTFICKIKKGIPKILEPEKCAAIAWYTLQEIENLDLPLSIITEYDIKQLKKKYRHGIPPEFDPYGSYNTETFEGTNNEKELKHLEKLLDKLTNEEVKQLTTRLIKFSSDPGNDRDVFIGILPEAKRADFYREYYKIIYSRKNGKK